jgi:hypothetical protein
MEYLPELIVAADWSVSDNKRWMVRAELGRGQQYLIYPPEPVGQITTFIDRLRETLSSGGTALVGFDFPIGLPIAYADKVGISSWRGALGVFGTPGWEQFYQRSDSPTLRQPFFPLPKRKGQKGNFRKQLAEALGFDNLDDLYRHCDRGTQYRTKAECLFFTLGGKQVGAGALVGWEQVLAPNRDNIRFWPFDGDFPDILKESGIVVAEIYPREAYSHLGISIGPGTGLSKTRRQDRQRVAAPVVKYINSKKIQISEAAKSWFYWGFASDDDFDAMMSLLSMLLIVTSKTEFSLPNDDPKIRNVEGWIFGQKA